MAVHAPLPPDFIKFLFSEKPKFDVYFEVGNKSQGNPERIGAVKLMLMAHSEVFRLELEDSDLREKKDVPIKDTHPDTFKGMLKYVYGYDTTADMEFDEADNMFYVAEKYMIKTLKDKLAVRLMELLNPDNICSLLNNPACHTHLELDSAITKILRYETDRVLASPLFVWMNADGFLQILQQDGLVVPEIELWRAAIKWAKHKANSEDGQMLRQHLSSLTPQLRLCTLTAEEFCTEVASSGVLTRDEIGGVCMSIGKKEKPTNLDCFSNETEPRKLLRRVQKVRQVLALSKLKGESDADRGEYNFKIITKDSSIELLPLVCRAKDHDNSNPEPQTYKVECTTTITKVANPSADEPPKTFTFSRNVVCGDKFKIPLAVDGRNITLLPHTEYRVKMVLRGGFKEWYSTNNGSGRYENDHLTLDITKGMVLYEFPSDKLRYAVVTPLEYS